MRTQSKVERMKKDFIYCKNENSEEEKKQEKQEKQEKQKK
jgi:hypothetical protein